MPAIPYAERRTIAGLIRSLTGEGLSRSEVRLRIRTLILVGDILPERELPPDWDFEFKAYDRIMIKASDLYEAAVNFRYRHPPPNYPMDPAPPSLPASASAPPTSIRVWSVNLVETVKLDGTPADEPPQPIDKPLPEPAAVSSADAMPKPMRAPDWLELVTPCFDEVIRNKGPFHVLGQLRDAVKAELKRQHRKRTDNRNIERMLLKHRSNWLNRNGH